MERFFERPNQRRKPALEGLVWQTEFLIVKPAHNTKVPFQDRVPTHQRRVVLNRARPDHIDQSAALRHAPYRFGCQVCAPDVEQRRTRPKFEREACERMAVEYNGRSISKERCDTPHVLLAH